MSEDQIRPASIADGKKHIWIWALAVGSGCLVILLCGVLVGGVGYYFANARSANEEATPTAIVRSTPVAPHKTRTPGLLPSPPTVAGNAMGDPNAPVTILEYSDFQCPYCRRFWSDTLPRINETYVKTGNVYFIYRSAGNFIGEESGDAAQAAYCAGDQGKFWEYHDILYENQTGENAGAFLYPKLLKFAKTLGLDEAAFGDCIKSGKYAEQVRWDSETMRTFGIQAVPSFLINGVLLTGAQPFEAFEAIIEAALQGN